MYPDDSVELLQLELQDVCALWEQATGQQYQTGIRRLWLAYRGGQILAEDPEVRPGPRAGNGDSLSLFFPHTSPEGLREAFKRNIGNWWKTYLHRQQHTIDWGMEWHSECLFVPVSAVFAAIAAVSRVA